MTLTQESEITSESAKTDQSEDTKPEDEFPKVAEGCIDGQVACDDGPVVNATVSVGMIRTSTDAKGNFLLEHVPPGIQKVIVKPRTSRFQNYEQDILIEAGMKKQGMFVFLTEVTGTIEGTVVDENGKPLVGAELSGVFGPAEPFVTAKTDDKGHYVFAEVPRGSYYIRAKGQGRMTEGAPVNVTGGSTIVSNFMLMPGNLTIRGNVVSKKEQGPVECDIYLMRKGIVVTRATLAGSGDGRFIFDNLVPDIYEISITARGHITMSWQGKLEKSETVNFELEEARPDTPTCGGF